MVLAERRLFEVLHQIAQTGKYPAQKPEAEDTDIEATLALELLSPRGVVVAVVATDRVHRSRDVVPRYGSPWAGQRALTFHEYSAQDTA